MVFQVQCREARSWWPSHTKTPFIFHETYKYSDFFQKYVKAQVFTWTSVQIFIDSNRVTHLSCSWQFEVQAYIQTALCDLNNLQGGLRFRGVKRTICLLKVFSLVHTIQGFQLGKDMISSKIYSYSTVRNTIKHTVYSIEIKI